MIIDSRIRIKFPIKSLFYLSPIFHFFFQNQYPRLTKLRDKPHCPLAEPQLNPKQKKKNWTSSTQTLLAPGDSNLRHWKKHTTQSEEEIENEVFTCIESIWCLYGPHT